MKAISSLALSLSLCLVALSQPVPTWAMQVKGFGADSLRQACMLENDYAQSLCRSYILTFMRSYTLGLASTFVVDRGEPKSQEQLKALQKTMKKVNGFCMTDYPEQQRDVVSVVKSYLLRNPDAKQSFAKDVVLAAMRERFPCQEQ